MNIEKMSDEIEEWFQSDLEGKVKAIQIATVGCSTCKQMEAIYSELSEKNDWFEYRVVDGWSLPFPPPSTPISYFRYGLFRDDWIQPEIRPGLGNLMGVENELKIMKRMVDTGKPVPEIEEELKMEGML